MKTELQIKATQKKNHARWQKENKDKHKKNVENYRKKLKERLQKDEDLKEKIREKAKKNVLKWGKNHPEAVREFNKIHALTAYYTGKEAVEGETEEDRKQRYQKIKKDVREKIKKDGYFRQKYTPEEALEATRIRGLAYYHSRKRAVEGETKEEKKQRYQKIKSELMAQSEIFKK